MNRAARGTLQDETRSLGGVRGSAHGGLPAHGCPMPVSSAQAGQRLLGGVPCTRLRRTPRPTLWRQNLQAVREAISRRRDRELGEGRSAPAVELVSWARADRSPAIEIRGKTCAKPSEAASEIMKLEIGGRGRRGATRVSHAP